MKTGIELIAEERQRQIEKEGWSREHDDGHEDFELSKAAVQYETEPDCRVMNSDTYGNIPDRWPWEPEAWKPTPDNRIKELKKAGALYTAEKERLHRLMPIEREGKKFMSVYSYQKAVEFIEQRIKCCADKIDELLPDYERKAFSNIHGAF